jgi:phage FluMu gp28-like protein
VRELCFVKCKIVKGKSEKMLNEETYFLPYQRVWIRDKSPLKICEKSRQIGLSYADSYDSVRKAGLKGGRNVWVMSRDEVQAKEYIRYCKHWATVLNCAAHDWGEQLFTLRDGQALKVQVLSFATRASIYALSSSPDAIVGKTGHVKLDEFALHKDQRMLYAVAKPVTQWGGTLSIISTHRGIGTVFNSLLTDIKQRGNPMGWSLHSVPIQTAVEQGLVERINEKTGRAESRADWLARQRAECLDEEQWLQEYCCVPADESTAFISYEMINTCEEPELRLLTLDELEEQLESPALHEQWAGTEEKEASSPRPSPPEEEREAPPGRFIVQGRVTGDMDAPYGTLGPHFHAHSGAQASTLGHQLYLGVDVARKHDLCVFDLGEKIGDVVWDRVRLELKDRSFSEIKSELYRLLRLPQVRRCCLDATGLGLQLAEEARADFGWKLEPIVFTAPVKEELAFGLRTAIQERKVRLVPDDKLRADLRGIRKEVTLSGNIRFLGESPDSHCDRFWAKALRQHAARAADEVCAVVG